jgi:hypothetical protein
MDWQLCRYARLMNDLAAEIDAQEKAYRREAHPHQ